MSRILPFAAALLLTLGAPARAAADESGSPWDQDGDEGSGSGDDGDETGTEGDAGDEGDEGGTEGDETGTETATPAPAATTAASAPAATPKADPTLPPKGGGIFGLGFTIGTINGLSIKLWPHRAHAIVLHVGVPNLLNSVAAALSYRVHPRPILVPDSPVALHINLGPVVRVRAAFTEAAFVELAGGLAAGLSITVQDVPAELFFEVVPLFAGSVTAVGTGLGFGVDGLVGARFYF